MATRKISLDIDAELYVRIKHAVFDRSVTMAEAMRELLEEKFGEKNESRT